MCLSEMCPKTVNDLPETHPAVDRNLLQCDDQGTNFMKAVITSDESMGTTQKQKPGHYNGRLCVL